MNERIKELAKQTGWSEDIRYAPRAKEIEKFAELIVRECAELNFRELGLSGSASFDVSRMIKQHFGVEEFMTTFRKVDNDSQPEALRRLHEDKE